MTQRELARRAGIPQSALSDFERGIRQPWPKAREALNEWLYPIYTLSATEQETIWGTCRIQRRMASVDPTSITPELIDDIRSGMVITMYPYTWNGNLSTWYKGTRPPVSLGQGYRLERKGEQGDCVTIGNVIISGYRAESRNMIRIEFEGTGPVYNNEETG